MNAKTLICAHCGAPFSTPTAAHNRKYHSPQCRNAAARKLERERIQSAGLSAQEPDFDAMWLSLALEETNEVVFHSASSFTVPDGIVVTPLTKPNEWRATRTPSSP